MFSNGMIDALHIFKFSVVDWYLPYGSIVWCQSGSTPLSCLAPRRSLMPFWTQTSAADADLCVPPSTWQITSNFFVRHDRRRLLPNVTRLVAPPCSLQRKRRPVFMGTEQSAYKLACANFNLTGLTFDLNREGSRRTRSCRIRWKYYDNVTNITVTVSNDIAVCPPSSQVLQPLKNMNRHCSSNCGNTFKKIMMIIWQKLLQSYTRACENLKPLMLICEDEVMKSL